MTFIVAPLQALFAGLSGAGAAGGAGGLGTGLALASAGAGLVGSAVQASGQRRAAEAEAQAAEFDAKAKQQQSEAEREAAQTEAEDFRRRQRRVLSERRATAGASGLTQAGSPLLVEESMLREIALGSARVGHQGAVRGSRLEDSATLDRMRAGNSRRAGRMAAGSTLLTGAGNFVGDLAGAWG